MSIKTRQQEETKKPGRTEECLVYGYIYNSVLEGKEKEGAVENNSEGGINEEEY